MKIAGLVNWAIFALKAVGQFKAAEGEKTKRNGQTILWEEHDISRAVAALYECRIG